ncbi:hypothetical protein ACFVMC_16380 [Nocardia sp. NPDC127579]|uniref:hypothetical protein n=1 Tax=Nocardia sp. NPDC127579 TaxID=3345402 RepID=UPI0036410C28
MIAAGVIAAGMSAGVVAPTAFAAPTEAPVHHSLSSWVESAKVQAGSPQNATLSAEEQAAVDNKNAGRPYDQKAYNRAMQKIKQAEKYDGCRNKQKRKSC